MPCPAHADVLYSVRAEVSISCLPPQFGRKQNFRQAQPVLARRKAQTQAVTVGRGGRRSLGLLPEGRGCLVTTYGIQFAKELSCPPPHSTPGGGFHTLPGVGNPDSVSTGGRTTVADWASGLRRAGGLLIPSPDGNDGNRSDGDSQLCA